MPSNFRHLAWIAAIGVATPASAQTFHSIDAIEVQVAATLGAAIGEPGGAARPIDRRLRLQQCPAPIIVEPVNLGAVTVRCQAIGWRIRVPVIQEASASTAAAPTLAAPARQRAARAELVVRRGDPVALVVVTGGFTVSRQAIAEQDGAPGDRIRVRTEPRAAPIVGQVLPDGRVAMGGFN